MTLHGVLLLLVCLCAVWTASLCQGLMYPIFQTMVVQERIGGIETNKGYEELCAAGKLAEVMLLQQMWKDMQQRSEGLAQQDEGDGHSFFQI
jgi:hypothetical protein